MSLGEVSDPADDLLATPIHPDSVRANRVERLFECEVEFRYIFALMDVIQVFKERRVSVISHKEKCTV